MKQEILDFIYELVEIIKEDEIQIIHEWSTNIDEELKQNEEDYQARRKKAEELVNKLN